MDFKSKFNPGSFLKWAVVAVAAITAASQAINEQKAREQLDEMEARIAALENEDEEETE